MRLIGAAENIVAKTPAASFHNHGLILSKI